MRTGTLISLLMPLFLLSCSYASKRSTEAIIYPTKGHSQTGIASWYGVEEHGGKAASGERFSMYDYTAAHKSLPLGTMLRVTNLENGKDVIVRINDRGPFVEGRIIDLSYTAAKSIDMLAKGTARVKVEVISVPGRKSNYFDAIYTVQIGSFNNQKNALSLKKELSRDMNDVRVEPIELDVGTYYRVRIGRFPNRDEAEKVSSKLRRKFGYQGSVILE